MVDLELSMLSPSQGYEDTEKYREKKKKDVRNGQNKALAAGWIKRDKGIFKAKVHTVLYPCQEGAASWASR